MKKLVDRINSDIVFYDTNADIVKAQIYFGTNKCNIDDIADYANDNDDSDWSDRYYVKEV